ncbi:hypothetical protein M0805_003196 [Coniferiporia weirii]|nr:hypothetical protein M0805_003196 [Coniferiporia weirii]
MAKVERDEVFYFSMTIIQVESTLFKVPRRPFEEQSDIFRSMFTLPPENNAQFDGMSDEKPLRLDGVKRDDFRAFLQVLLPPSYGDEMEFSEKEWLSILNLANMWNFTKIRQTAIEKLQRNNIDIVTKVELAHRYDIREWLFGGYLALGKREEPLTVEEAARLGFDFAVKMARVREQLLRDKIAHPNAYRTRPSFIPSRGDSPRGSSRNSQSLRSRVIPSNLFPGELEDEDDLVLSKAINEVFGIRGEPRFAYSTNIEQEELVLHPPFNPQGVPWPYDIIDQL